MIHLSKQKQFCLLDIGEPYSSPYIFPQIQPQISTGTDVTESLKFSALYYWRVKVKGDIIS